MFGILSGWADASQLSPRVDQRDPRDTRALPLRHVIQKFRITFWALLALSLVRSLASSGSEQRR